MPDPNVPLPFQRQVTSEEVARFHMQSDVDKSIDAQHHTLGEGDTQAASGGKLKRLSDRVEQLAGQIVPPVDSGWIDVTSFTNSYSSDSAGNSNKVAYRDVNGTIYLKGGLLRGTATGSAWIAAFTLPAGYRPASVVYLGGVMDNLATFTGVKITAAGVVSVWCNAVHSATPGVALNGISFLKN